MRPIVPQPPSSQFPIPRCPPWNPVDRAYQLRLDKMSVPELRAEKQKLQRMLMLKIRRPPKEVARIKLQLAMVNKELASRQKLPPKDLQPRPPQDIWFPR